MELLRSLTGTETDFSVRLFRNRGTRALVKALVDAATTPLGRITISREAIAQIVARTAAESYGVVGMAGRRLRRKAIDVSTADEGGLRIDLHVVVEYGLNLAEVGNSIRSRVRYEVERLTQLPVAAVEVHIDAVRES